MPADAGRAPLGEGFLMAQGKKWTQAEVDAWLAEHRPDFVPASGWVYVNTYTPIAGECRVCGAECAPRLNDMKNHGLGHCRLCGDRAIGATSRARAEAEVRRVAAERGYEVVDVFCKPRKDGSRNSTYATLYCYCGNEWEARQDSLCSTGSGCPSCAESGFDTGKPAELYLLTRNKRGLQETQYGISNVLNQRLARHDANGWRLVDVISGPGTEILALEKLIKDAMKAEGIYRREYHDEKYDGYTEAWDASDGLRPFMSLEFLLSWAAARAGSRERRAA